MATLRALYDALKDSAVFGDYYTRHHTLLVKKIAGLKPLTTSRGPIAGLARNAPHLVGCGGMHL